MEENKLEPILQEENKRYTILPLQFPDIYDFYQEQKHAFWTEDEIDLSKDLTDWEKLNDNERYFVKHILAFFSASDAIVNENISLNFINEVQYAEAKKFYGIQTAIEDIHSIVYALLIDTYIKNIDERNDCFNALENMPIVAKKGNWALDWIPNSTFAERLVAFAAVEGIFFSGSFCSIFWLKDRNLMSGLSFANDLIQRDEALHTDFAIHLLNHHVVNKPSPERIKEIMLSALEIEKEFVSESLPVSLIGINALTMCQYLEYVTDQLLIKMGIPAHFNVKQPFTFMTQIALKGKTNFFEKRVGEYQKSDLSGKVTFDEEF